MRCEVCHGVVLSIEEERNPIEVQERVDGAVRTYSIHCCGGCRQKIADEGAEERNPKGGAA